MFWVYVLQNPQGNFYVGHTGCHLNALPLRLASLPVYGRGCGTGRDLGVGVGLGLGVGVGLDCAQYFPPVLKLAVSSVPPQTIISLPVQTAV